MASLEAPGAASRPESSSVAGGRERDIGCSGIVGGTNDEDGGGRGVGGDHGEPSVMVAGLVPEVGAYGEDGAPATNGPILVRDKAVAWR